MHYLFSEAEYNSIEGVRGQLRLVRDLCFDREGGTLGVQPADLLDFLSGQVDMLTSVLAAAYKRYEFDRSGAGMTPSDWLGMIQILAGDLDPRVHDASTIGVKLTRQAKEDGDMQPVLDAWLSALVALGEQQRAERSKVSAKAKPARKRDRLSAAGV